MADRELVGFDLLPEDIPPIPGESHDWTRETPDIPAMANQNLRVTSATHPGEFQQVLAFASRIFEKANPGMLAGQTDVEAQDGKPVACTVFPVPRN
jgi:hypothetical protein